MKLKKKHKMIIIILSILIVFAGAVFGHYTYLTRTKFTTTHYTVINEKIKSEIRIAQISDLHNKSFGKDNVRLIEAVDNSNADIAVITGDLFSRNTKDISPYLDLLSELSKSRPVFYAMGNHEKSYCKHNQIEISDFLSNVSDSGVIPLERKFVDTEINSTPIRIGGVCGYCVSPDKLKYEEYKNTYRLDHDYDYLWERGGDYCFIRNFEETDNYRILLAHHPESFVYMDGFEHYDSELVLSGHLHGGQVVLPGIGPLFSPFSGILPKKNTVQGLHTYTDSAYGQDNVLIISRGIGSHGIFPRINNIGELVIVDLKPAK